MLIPVLVVTIDSSFGELVRESLEETGQFSVLVTRNLSEAETFIKETDCSVVFLDPGMDADETLTIGFQLLEIRADLHFVLVAEPDQRAALDIFKPQAYLTKPFYLPDLIEIIYKLYPDMNPNPEKNVKGKSALRDAPSWLSDVNRAAQHLTRLTLESSAQAAMITQGDQLWAYAGQLPQSAALELTSAVTRYWDRDESDLVRFVKLVATRAEHMLYATHLAPGMVLALVFDAETPFHKIRSQASQLVRSMSSFPKEGEDVPGDETPLTSLSSILSDATPGDPKLDDSSPSTDEKPRSIDASDVRSSTSNRIATDQPDTGSKRWSFIRERVPSLFNRETSLSPGRNLDDSTSSQELLETRQNLPFRTMEEQAVTVRSRSIQKEADQGLQESEDAHLRPFGGRQIILEPVSPSVYDIDYACLLVPRFPHHYLTGDLSSQIGIWVQDLCVAFAWRLEHISIRPDYLQWIVNVPPSTSPANLMDTLRRYTSEQIFADFPRFARENPSGDFWAPGYLILSGSQPPPAQLIKDFIVSTRLRQGLPPSIDY